MLQYIRTLLERDRSADETGASAVEYGLLVGGIAAVIIVLVMALGGQIGGIFDKTCTDIDANSTATSTSTQTC
jgi:pilus assembly protein Flp/PilA